ncbi:MAG TPA: response regulator [bacterium]|nr:response regulator [bacterium]HQI47915.1 response regulator [bacterium]HQJ66321.1 response regulator [bacterium]
MSDSNVEKNLILLVEDDPDQAQVLRYFLGANGYAVEWQNAPRLAYESARSKSFQLILLDIMLNAEEDGFDLCRQFKQEEGLKNIPIIMVTARADVKDRVSGLRAGADDYIIKPFSQEELLARVQAVLARKRYFDFNEKYRTLLENSDDIVLFLNLSGEIEQTNHQAAVKLYGLEPGGGKFPLHALFAEPFAGNLVQLYPRVAAGFDISGNNWRLSAPHGGMEIVDVRLVPLSQGHRISGMGCILRDATPREKVLQAMEAQTRDLASQVKHTNAQLGEMQQQLILSEKMAVMGQLAAGVAHELRNPLNIISTSVYYLRRILASEHPKAREHFSILDEEIARAQRIINSLLDFARKSPAERSEIDVNAVLLQTLALVKKELAMNDILVRTELAESVKAWVNSDDLKQILLNLILNAKEAMPYGGKLYIRTSHAGGNGVQMEFSDTGVGIPPAIQDKVFDPFFTYGKEGKGVGLGLTIVHSAVERNQGHIALNSEVDRGTTFRITLPAHRAEAGQEEK